MDVPNMEVQRNVEDVMIIFEHAKLDVAEFKSGIQCLTFGQHLESDTIKLLEVEPPVLDCIKTGDRLVLRGLKDDSAYLCTPDLSFEMREAHTSNTLLLMPTCKLPDAVADEGDRDITFSQVCAVKQEYYELRKVLPRLNRLGAMLQENPYSGKECEQDEHHQGPKYTFEELADCVQASENQLKKGLAELQACQIDGYYRMLDFDFKEKVLGSILLTKDEMGWEYNSILHKQCCEIMEDLFHQDVTSHVLKCFSEKSDSGDEEICKLSEDAICRHYAELLLRSNNKFDLKDFLDSWPLAVPEGLNTSLYQLEGLGLIDRESKPPNISYYPVSDLPQDIDERFNTLFKTKEKWSLEEIKPYIIDLSTEKVGVGAMLMKFARTSTQNGIKVYSSKRILY